MKKTLLLCLIGFLSLQLFAQSGTCTPDESVINPDNPLEVIYPLPYNETTMTGGIPITACQNQPFELVFTANVPEEILFNNFQVDLNHIEVMENGVNNLPDGLTYACNPPNCLFESGALGCIVVYGTPTDAVGDYDLTLNLTISTDILGDQDSVEPGLLFPGSYTLTVEEENAGSCFIVGTSDVLAENLQFNANPNPFGAYTQIDITSGIQQELLFEVQDLLGKSLWMQNVQLQEGQNTIVFDGSQLAEGMYIYSLRKGSAVISKKMIINR